MLTTHDFLRVRVPARSPERVVDRVKPEQRGHSRWEIAALLGTLSLLLPFGLLVMLGL
jgi:hypothetical protein